MNALYALIEKVIWTYVQSLIAIMTMGDRLNINITTELAIAALPAALTVIANGLQAAALPMNLPFGVDLLFRIIKTFAATFLGSLIAQPVFQLSIGAGRAGFLAGLAAVIVVIKGVAARQLGDPQSAATLPMPAN